MGPSVHVLRKDTMMANSAVLGSILVMLGFAFDAIPVSVTSLACVATDPLVSGSDVMWIAVGS